MKLFGLILFLFTSISAYSQSLEDWQNEEVARFDTSLVAYDIHNNKLIALTQEKGDYFVHFESVDGEKVQKLMNISSATKFTTDCMGNLFLVGVDSAIQLSIADKVTRVQTLDLETYKVNILSCRALFNESLVRNSFNHSLVYEPLDDSVFAQIPVLSTIQFWSDGYATSAVRTPNSQMVSSTFVPRDSVTRWHNGNNGRYYMYPAHTNNTVLRSAQRFRASPGRMRASPLYAFQVKDQLWVFVQTGRRLIRYNEYGSLESDSHIEGLGTEFQFVQDKETQKIYSISQNGGYLDLQEIKENGVLSKRVKFSLGFSKSDLKIVDGYLYFRESEVSGESINRVQLN
jgi:hypothetical protein